MMKPCGNQFMGGFSLPCVLPAGHVEPHSDGIGGQWGDVPAGFAVATIKGTKEVRLVPQELIKCDAFRLLSEPGVDTDRIQAEHNRARRIMEQIERSQLSLPLAGENEER